MSGEARELVAFTDNERAAYDAMKPIYKRLNWRLRNGSFDYELAPAAFRPVLLRAAKRYAETYGRLPKSKLFSAQDITQAAKHYALTVQEDFLNGCLE